MIQEAMARLSAAVAAADGRLSLEALLSSMDPAFRSDGYRAEGPWQRILALRWDEIGDSVLTSAFLRELRRNFPEAQIDLIVKPAAFGIMERCPYADHVRAVTPQTTMSEAWFSWAESLCGDLLWLVRYDACFLLRWDVDLAFAPLVAYLSGAREQRKAYPPELHVQALRALLPLGILFVLLGGEGDRSAGEAVCRGLPVGRALNLAGRTSLRESAAIVAASRLFLGGDTGLTHIAAAVHVPIVEWCNHPLDVPVTTLSLFARFYPWQARAIVLRPPRHAAGCGRLRTVIDAMTPCRVVDEPHCICGIAPEQVARAARTLLGETVQGGMAHAD